MGNFYYLVKCQNLNKDSLGIQNVFLSTQQFLLWYTLCIIFQLVKCSSWFFFFCFFFKCAGEREPDSSNYLPLFGSSICLVYVIIQFCSFQIFIQNTSMLQTFESFIYYQKVLSRFTLKCNYPCKLSFLGFTAHISKFKCAIVLLFYYYYHASNGSSNLLARKCVLITVQCHTFNMGFKNICLSSIFMHFWGGGGI